MEAPIAAVGEAAEIIDAWDPMHPELLKIRTTFPQAADQIAPIKE